MLVHLLTVNCVQVGEYMENACYIRACSSLVARVCVYVFVCVLPYICALVYVCLLAHIVRAYVCGPEKMK